MNPINNPQPIPGPQPKFDPEAAHHQKPKLRPVRGFPAKVGDQMALGLADARQITDRMVVTSPAVQHLLPMMDGQKTIDEIVTAVGKGLTRPIMETLVAQLDDAGLLFGPRFDELLAKMRADFDAAPILPPSSTAAFADFLVAQHLGLKAPAQPTDEQKKTLGPERLRAAMNEWMDKSLENAETPSFDELPRALVAPHIDYPRGWMNYAHAWGRMRIVDRPERVIILGTNHFGQSTGVAACDKGYETPLGVSPLDAEFAGRMRSRLGDRLFENRYDHEREHSIELQVAWVQHVLGTGEGGAHCGVFAALAPPPGVNTGVTYAGLGVALLPCVAGGSASIDESPGQTLVIASADLSHVGPMFGDQQALAGEDEKAEAFRNKVLSHDREMIELLRQRKAEELVASMAWQQNPTRWCSTGNLVAAMLTVRPERVELLNYAAAMDPQGMGMVSTVAMAMW